MEGPYRAAKPLTEIITPDRRRQRAIVLVLVSMVAGAILFQVARAALEPAPAIPVVTTDPARLLVDRIAPVTLHGPDGTLRIPSGETMVVNVWLQGCADCMPAFEAMKTLDTHGGIGMGTTVKIVNVAYGEADPSWAARYHVRQNLVDDPGGNAIVRPLGITSFVTLVIDGDGNILHRDRPDRAGYVERVRRAVSHTDDPTIDPPLPASVTQAEIERVVAAHRKAVKRDCWDTRTDVPTNASVRVEAVVGPNGDVVSAVSSGTDALVASCVEEHVRTWKFPAHRERSGTVGLPFIFKRE